MIGLLSLARAFDAPLLSIYSVNTVECLKEWRNQLLRRWLLFRVGLINPSGKCSVLAIQPRFRDRNIGYVFRTFYHTFTKSLYLKDHLKYLYIIGPSVTRRDLNHEVLSGRLYCQLQTLCSLSLCMCYRDGFKPRPEGVQGIAIFHDK